MASAIDIYMLEKQYGKNATVKLRAAFKFEIARSVNVRGESKNATVTNRFRQNRLERLSFVAPHYIFKQHNGFEGTKSNGVNMRLIATDVLNKALNRSGILETLADDLSGLRAEEVITAINF